MNRPNLAVLSMIATAALAIVGGPPASAAGRPNVVLLLADDLGYGDLGCTGHPYARTPAIDQLARQGTRFSNFYAGGATCCPSRTALMTGRFPATFARYPASFGFGGAATVTDLLNQSGYRTGHFGKWHIGAEPRPGAYGIDSIQVSGGNRRDPRGRDAEIADRTIEFLRSNRDKPFFVNVWFHTPHAPVKPPRGFADQFAKVAVDRADFKNPDMLRHLDLYRKLGGDVDEGMRNYLGDVLQLDGQVARILKAIDDLGLRDDTIVVFTSDNGPAKCSGADAEDEATPKKQAEKLKENMLGSPGVFRDRKHSLHDGGVHLPFIVRWPGRVPEGRVDDRSVIAGVDFLPTLCSALGLEVAPGKLDGEDVSAAWLGRDFERKNALFWKASAPRSTPAIRRGPWKLHQPRRGEVELYDLAKDPGERDNAAGRHPEVARELGEALRRWNAGLPTSYEKGSASDD